MVVPSQGQRIKRGFSKAKSEPNIISNYSWKFVKAVTALFVFLAGASGINSYLDPAFGVNIAIVNPVILLYWLFFLSALWLIKCFSMIFDVVKYYFHSRNAGIKPAGYILPVSESLRRFIVKSQSDNFSAGSAIEIFSHPFIDYRLEDNGWHVGDINIIETGKTIRIPSYVNSDFTLTGSNNNKYTMINYDIPFSDSAEKLNLYIGKSDWLSVQKCRDFLLKNEVIRHEEMSYEFGTTRAPTSFCLHFVCLSKENYFLALRRRPDVAYYPNALAISFEEQFDELDLHYGQSGRAEAWFRRALCEEVFPLTGPIRSDPLKTWEKVSSFVEYMRIWQGFFEEDTANISLFGVCKLNISVVDMPQIFRDIERDETSRRDNEGRLYYLDLVQIENLLLSGHATCTSLYHPSSPAYVVKNLHPTSLYRASQVFRCMKR